MSHFQNNTPIFDEKYIEKTMFINQLNNDKTLIISTTQGSFEVGLPPVDKKMGVAIIKPMAGIVSRIILALFFTISLNTM